MRHGGIAAVPSPGDRVGGRFVLDRVVGSGGAGTVFRAVDARDGAPVAIKLMAAGDVDTGRFSREVGILAELCHPGVVRYVAHGIDPDGTHYIAMEWLEGEDLASLLARRRLSTEEVLALGRRVAEALAFAHRRGVVHRDVKPSNLCVPGGDVERVKLIDFGLARPARPERPITRTGAILGTPAYMAPEQVQGAPSPSPASDVFALGCVLFECLSGRPPFEGGNLVARLAKILVQESPSLGTLRPGIPPSLDRLVGRMLAKDPADRPRDGAAVATALSVIGAGTQAPCTGRQREIGMLEGMLAGCREESVATAVLVVGPPGSGKTRLVHELVTRARERGDDLRILTGRVMGDGLRAAWEEWIAAECAARPVLLVLDDLHRVDSATERAVEATLRRHHDRPLMVIGLGRPEGHPPSWLGPGGQTLVLRPLARRASGELCARSVDAPILVAR